MNKKLMTIIIATVSAVALVILAVLFLGSSSDNKDVNELFDAQMAAIKGDNSKIESLGYEVNYSVESLSALQESGLTARPSQSAAANRALNEFTYKITDVKEVEDGVYELSYEIDRYPIVDSMLEYTGNPDKYLTEEELNIFNNSENYTPQERSAVISKLMDLYDQNLPSITPTRVSGTVTYINVDGKIAIKDLSQFKEIVKTILGVSNISTN